MDRVILHSDANSFYASVECLYNPDIRDKPVAVCGDPEARHGIVLTKNQQAKRYGVKTGEAIWQAMRKCPNLVVVAPRYDMYRRFSRLLREIYVDFSDRVEAFGLDECWIDVSGKNADAETGRAIADEIRRRVREELGITVSVGVSFNKVFAKLGSDMKKPDATTVISRENYQNSVWNLPASNMLFVGRSVMKKLLQIGVITVGDLANADEALLRASIGKAGLMLKTFAMGLDDQPVMRYTDSVAEKSIGNSVTPPKDMETMDDVRCVIYMLAESVASRLRKAGLKSGLVSVAVRKPSLDWYSHQRRIKVSTNITDDIARLAMTLYMEKFSAWLPLRGMGVQCSLLVPDSVPVQIDMLGRIEKTQKLETLDKTIDNLRQRFGYGVIRRGVVLINEAFKRADSFGEHINIGSAQFHL
ncbi:MAG: DNA polymerase IV [Clostridia bacterium]|nr:DNA polymerase IV [Clostridia bacterium]